MADRLCLSYSQAKALSNKASTLTKTMNMDIWVAVTSNQLFIRGSYAETNFPKKKVVTGKIPFFAIVPFCTPHSLCLKVRTQCFSEKFRKQNFLDISYSFWKDLSREY